MRTGTIERSILRYVNAERKKRGLRTLAGHPRLIRAARGHSRWMARSGTFSHQSKGCSDHQDRAEAEGYHVTQVRTSGRRRSKKGTGRLGKSRVRRTIATDGKTIRDWARRLSSLG